MPTTIRSLAKELQLAVSTVSKALADSHEISALTKKRVLELARQKKYVPNTYAGSLRKKKSKTIAVVLPEVADSFFSLAINGIEAAAQEKGYHVLVYLTHESFTKEESILTDFQGGRVDGILMSVSQDTISGTHIRDVMNRDIPVIFFDRICEEVEASSVVTNDFEAGYQATQHLVKQGCKKIAFLTISATLSMSNRRLEGYKKALSDHRLVSRPEDVVVCTNDMAQNLSLVKKILDSPTRPDAIIACAEKLITPVYTACRELQLKIPAAVKVVGFSSQETAPILNPSLTTVTQPAFDMGKAAATLLIKTLVKPGNNTAPSQTVLPSIFITRDSSV